MNNKVKLILLIFTIVFTALVLPNLLNQNLIGDEPVYIVEGDRYLHQPYSFYHNSGSPVLLKVMTAIPYSVLPLNRKYDPYYKAVQTNVYTVAEFTYTQNEKFAKSIINLARIPHFLLALALGITLFLWTKKVFSLQTACIALGLYTFHATFLGHAGTANLDIGVTAFCFWSLILFDYYLEVPNKNAFKVLVLVGVFLGLAQATKISAILLYPIFIYWFLIKKSDKKIAQLVSIFLISVSTLWALYLFQVGPILTGDDTPAGIESVYGSIPILSNYKAEITSFLYRPIFPLGAYLNNFAYQFSHSFFGHTNFLLGTFTDQGIWYYIPVVFMIKNSLVLIGATFMGASLIVLLKGKDRKIHLFLWGWIVLVLAWSMQSKIQLGIRYAMPLFPFLFISAACGIEYWTNRLIHPRFQRAVLVGLIIVYALSTLRVGTNYFTYISELYYGYNPVDLVFDSDFDWGQGVNTVARYQQTNKLYPIYFRPYIGGSIEYEKIDNTSDPAQAFYNHKNGYYAFSHSALVNTRNSEPLIYSYFYPKRPDYIISKTIYVYKVDFK